MPTDSSAPFNHYSTLKKSTPETRDKGKVRRAGRGGAKKAKARAERERAKAAQALQNAQFQTDYPPLSPQS